MPMLLQRMFLRILFLVPLLMYFKVLVFYLENTVFSWIKKCIPWFISHMESLCLSILKVRYNNGETNDKCDSTNSERQTTQAVYDLDAFGMNDHNIQQI